MNIVIVDSVCSVIGNFNMLVTANYIDWNINYNIIYAILVIPVLAPHDSY